MKDKARLNLLSEFEDNIYEPKEKDKKTGLRKPPLLKRGKETFELIDKYYRHYDDLFENDNHSFTNSFEFNNLIVCMKISLPSTDWIPPLLSYYNKFSDTKIFEFLKKLDNKASGDWISQLSPSSRIENMSSILKGIEDCSTPDALFNTTLFGLDNDSLMKSLDGKVYGRRFAKHVLLKLDYIFNDNRTAKWSAFSQITVEHILPQIPESKSGWKQLFTDAERAEWTNRIGNLILLGRAKNASQGRLDYLAKQQKYFAKNINTFPNSLRVVNKYRTAWSKTELAENQQFVLKTLKDYYGV